MGLLCIYTKDFRVDGSIRRSHAYSFEAREKIANTVGSIILALSLTVLPVMIAPIVLLNFGFSQVDLTPMRPFHFINFVSLLMDY